MLEGIIEQSKDFITKDAYVLAYFYDQVVLGTYCLHDIYFHEDVDESLLTEIHIFNDDEEFIGKKFKGDWFYTYYHKKQLENQQYIRADAEYYYLVGNDLIEVYDDGFTKISHIEGKDLVVPFKVSRKQIKQGICLKVDTYLEYKNNQLSVKCYKLSGFYCCKGGNEYVRC